MTYKYAKRGAIKAFLNGAIASNVDDCILWNFARNSAGYGHFSLDGKHQLAHRYVCEKVHGAPFNGAYAAHSCGNGHLSCINPRHLSWKTAKGNSEDAIAQGRTVRGRHPRAKLTADGVCYIKRNAGRLTPTKMGKTLGVSRFVVHRVLSGHSWKWVNTDVAV